MSFTHKNRHKGTWRQGDFIVKNPKTRGFMILGRRYESLCILTQKRGAYRLISDGVLNPSGVRFGSAEIYAVLDQFRDDFDDTLCVGQRRPEDDDERVLLFCKMRPGIKFTDALVQRVKSAIRQALSARHVPAYIFEIADIPVRNLFVCKLQKKTYYCS